MTLHQIQITIALAELFADQGELDMQPELNIDLLDKTMDHIETLAAFQAEGVDLEDRWVQHHWGVQLRNEQGKTCGTAMCFAGHAVVLAGHRLVTVGGSDQFAVATDDKAGFAPIGNFAERELGLTFDEAAALFKASNNVGRLREVIEDIKAGKFR